jgi:hypothetical protein
LLEPTKKTDRALHMSRDKLQKTLKVIAYSGYKANERPLRLILGDKKLEIVRIIDRWIGEDHDYFKCLADDGQVYLLKWHRIQDEWHLVASHDG